MLTSRTDRREQWVKNVVLARGDGAEQPSVIAISEALCPGASILGVANHHILDRGVVGGRRGVVDGS